MESGMKFGAPWGVSLKLMTAVSVGVLLGIPAIGLSTGPHGNLIWIMGMIVMPLLILGVAVFFVIRGYMVIDRQLLVQRLGWNSQLSLDNLVSVEYDPQAMRRSLRTFGNGGLFCFAGQFRNKRLGAYRAFATAPQLAVVLKFPDRTVVVTPDDPQKFVDAVNRLIGERV